MFLFDVPRPLDAFVLPSHQLIPFINCSFFSLCVCAAVGWGREPVWHQVYQTDARGQSGWYFAQPQRRARLRCEIILLIRLLFCPLHNEASDSQRFFARLLFLGFHIRGSIGPRESKGRLLIRTPSEKRTPTQQQPTHAHQVTQRKTLLWVCIQEKRSKNFSSWSSQLNP